MATPFEVFDWPYEIRHIPEQTSGVYDPSAPGVWLPPEDTDPVVITGHLASYGASERNRFESAWAPGTDTGPLEAGDRRFYTTATLAKGDLLEFDLDDAGSSFITYRVLARAHTQVLMQRYVGGTLRSEWRVREVPA